jgi:hypothetical protein
MMVLYNELIKSNTIYGGFIMKKKFVAVVALAMLVLAISAPIAFAQDNNKSDSSRVAGTMFDYRKDWVQKAIQNGDITKEEAQQWEEHFNAMEKYHEEYGYGRGCGRYFNNDTGSTNGTDNNQAGSQYYGRGMRGYGRGMMGYGRSVMGNGRSMMSYGRSMMGNLY